MASSGSQTEMASVRAASRSDVPPGGHPRAAPAPPPGRAPPSARSSSDENDLTRSKNQLLLPILTEAENPPPNAPKPRPGHPRRVYRPRKTLTIRREQTRDGYTLHFTGREVDSELLDVVFDEIERMFAPG